MPDKRIPLRRFLKRADASLSQGSFAKPVLMIFMACFLMAGFSSFSRLSANSLEEKAASQLDADVIVVGAGISGLSAAIEAADRGLSVLVLDMNSVFGGHAVISEGVLSIPASPAQKAQGIEDSAELAYQDFVAWGEDPDDDWLRYYVNNASEEIYNWLTGLGVEFYFIAQPPGNSVPRAHFPKGAGLSLVTPIYRKALEYPNIYFLWNARVDSLLMENQDVMGVSVTDLRSAKTTDYHANATVIATGGFQSNLQMVLDHWPSDMPKPGRILAGSGIHSQGSGLGLAQSAGAALQRMDQQWNYVRGLPHPAYVEENRGLSFFALPGKARQDIWLNDRGERFANECLSPKTNLPRLLAQPNQRYWSVFDEKNKPNMKIAGPGWTPERMEREIYSNPEIVRVASTLDELAESMDLPAEALKRSIEKYNAQVLEGIDVDQGRFGGSIQDSCGNLPATMDTPPFYAVRLYPLARKSMGGIRVNLQTQVLHRDDQPISGLYAVGEASGFAGINGNAGLEGTFLGPSIVTGRVAGRSIGAHLQPVDTAALENKESKSPSIHLNSMSAKDCLDCHQLTTQIEQDHPGYEHYGYVHELVLQRNLPCQACHVEMFPSSPAYNRDGTVSLTINLDTHKIDAASLVNSCTFCHGDSSH